MNPLEGREQDGKVSPPDSLPFGYVLRPAQSCDRWALQALVLSLICEVALGFDFRIISYRVLHILVLASLASVQFWAALQVDPVPLQSVLTVSALCTALGAIALAVFLLLYLVLIPTEPLFNWPLYSVVEVEQQPIACAAVSYFGDFGVVYHVIVAKPWRRQAIASNLVYQLTKESKLPLYLVCKPHLVGFYQRLGFTVMPWKHLTKTLQAHFKDFELDRTLSGTRWNVMRFSPIVSVTPSTAVE